MTALAPSVRRHDPHTAERVRRWRERKRLGEQAELVERKALGTYETNEFRDPGPAIAAGEPFSDDFEWCDAEWARLLADARFVDVAPSRR